MKTIRNYPAIISLIFLVSVASLRAGDLFWDADPVNTAGIQDGPGTWDVVTNVWWDGANYDVWDNATPANAIFGTNSGTAGQITVAASTTINVGNLTVNPPSAGNYNFSPGDANSRLSFIPGSTVTIGGALLITNTVIFTGGSSFTKAGSGAYWIRPASANLNSGTTVVTAGTLVMGSSSGRVVVPGDLVVTNSGDARLGAANTILNTATVSVASGATFEMNGNALAMANFVLNGGTVTQTGTEALTVQNLDARSGAISQNTGATGKLDGNLTKSTTGTVTLTGRGSSAASGGLTNTIVNDGTLILDYTQNSSKLNDSGSFTINGGTVVFANGTHSEAVASVVLAGGVITNSSGTAKFTLGAGIYDARSGSVYTVLTGAAGLVKTTTGTEILAAVDTYTGGTTISAGVLQLGDGTTSGTVNSGTGTITDNSSLVLDPGSAATISSVISGSGSVTKIGGGTASLTPVNSYQGSTTISNGILTIDSDATLGDGTGTLNLSGGTLSSTASRTPASAPVANPITVTANSAITTASTAATVDFNLSNDSIGGSAGSLTFSNAAASGTGVFEPRFSGSGFNFSLPITIANGVAGTTRLDSFNTIGTTQTFSGPISGNGGFRRNASVSGTGGATVMTGPNIYTGITDVSQGSLQVDGSLGASTVTVDPNGTLGGNGTINGPVTINGTLSAGSGIGILTINNTLAFQASGTNVAEINKSLGTNDLVRGISTLNYAGTLVVVNLAGDPALNDTYKIFDASSYSGLFSNYVLPALDAGLAWDTSGLTSNGSIKVVSASAPTLGFTQSNGIEQFSWTGGFKLQVQTNALGVGISANWVDYPGGSISPVSVTNDPANGAVFFRLISTP